MPLSMLFTLGKWALNIGQAVIGVFTGGSLESILRTIDKGLDEGVEKERVKADVTKKWIDAQANLLVGRTWWFQLFFVIPLGIYFSAHAWVAAFPFWGWQVNTLQSPLDEWSTYIIAALFIVDGGKALIGSAKK